MDGHPCPRGHDRTPLTDRLTVICSAERRACSCEDVERSPESGRVPIPRRKGMGCRSRRRMWTLWESQVRRSPACSTLEPASRSIGDLSRGFCDPVISTGTHRDRSTSSIIVVVVRAAPVGGHENLPTGGQQILHGDERPEWRIRGAAQLWITRVTGDMGRDRLSSISDVKRGGFGDRCGERGSRSQRPSGGPRGQR
jgi:hypothetical protein